MALPHVDKLAYRPASPSGGRSTVKVSILGEEEFRKMLAIERKRTERSNEPFLLVLVDGIDRLGGWNKVPGLDRAVHKLAQTLRETDVFGWYLAASTLGLIFTGLPAKYESSAIQTIMDRVRNVLQSSLTAEQFEKIQLHYHIYPDEWKADEPGERSNPVLYPDLCSPSKQRKVLLKIKRMIDIVGSAFLLLLTSPLFVVIALAVKLSSRGPIFFRQTRVGQHGRHFTFLKFRSMYAGNDQGVHQKYVQQLIAGKVQSIAVEKESEHVYKMTDDKRITAVGKFLRRTSLDELPQFLNVLLGDMSLVGPRPPIPYELEAYETWHRNRLLQVRPGITGLWQVTGRSRVSFDEMVRLDLQYAVSWSPMLDIQILLRTPAAVIKGAY